MGLVGGNFRDADSGVSIPLGRAVSDGSSSSSAHVLHVSSLFPGALAPVVGGGRGPVTMEAASTARGGDHPLEGFDAKFRIMFSSLSWCCRSVFHP